MNTAILLLLLPPALAKLVFVASIARHGARDTASPEYIPHYNGSIDQLTPVGMRQQLNLGNHLRQKYVVEHQLISEVYLAQEVKVTSSDLNRTLDSASSLVQGLFRPGLGPTISSGLPADLLLPPLLSAKNILKGKSALPNQMQICSILTREERRDFVLRANNNCPILTRLQAERRATPYYKWVDRQMTPLYDWAEKAFKQPIKETRDLTIFNDIDSNRHVNHFKGIPWPYLPESSPLMAPFEFVSNWAPAYVVTGSTLQIAVQISELLSEILSGMESAIAHPSSSPKLLLFSGHDGNLLPLMRAMGLMSPQCYERSFFNHTLSAKPLYCHSFPGFASNLQIELHVQEGQHHVQVIYNSKAVQLCPPREQCTLQEFFEFQQKYHLHDFEAVCQDKEFMGRQRREKESTVLIVLAIVLGVLIMGCLMLWFRIEQRKKEWNILLQEG